MEVPSNFDMNFHNKNFVPFQPSISSYSLPLINNRSEFFGNITMEPPSGLKHDTGLAVYWSADEHATLIDALNKLRDETGVMKYVKISGLLPQKNVRDVALRCQWMARKERINMRKIEQFGRKNQSRMNEIATTNHLLVPRDSLAAYSSMSYPVHMNSQLPREVPMVDSTTQLQQLADINSQVLNQISENLTTLKLQDNYELLSRARENFATIQNRMSQMPGIMSQMPALPELIDDELFNYILSCMSVIQNSVPVTFLDSNGDQSVSVLIQRFVGRQL